MFENITEILSINEYLSSSDEYNSWVALRLEAQKALEHNVDETTHYNYSYSYYSHSDSHTDRDGAHSDKDVPKHNNRTGTRWNDSYYDPGTRRTWRNSYSAGGGYDDSYYAHSDSTPHSNSSHDNDTHHNGSYNQGFDHLNYIPSIPELYELEGGVVNDIAAFRIFSYDKNGDGEGSQDEDSINILYSLKIRRVKDLNGNDVSDAWITVLDKSPTNEVDLDMTSKPEGIYEMVAQTHNKPRSENGISKTYDSEAKTSYFTLMFNNVPDITILNAEEFAFYSYGLDGAMSSNTFKDYAESILYANAPETSQAGIFIEFTLTDLDPNEYHKVEVALEMPDGTLITEKYPATLELAEDGISPKAGDNSGVVFIPLGDMLDNGSVENAKVMFYLTDYEQKAMTKPKSVTARKQAMDELDNYLFVNLDNVYPNITITPAEDHWVTTKNVSISYTDEGLGILKSYYQIVPSGENSSNTGWHQVADANRNASQVLINTEGIWDVYAKTVDRAGNVTIASSSAFMVSPIEMTMTVPAHCYIGFNSTFNSTVSSKVECEKTEWWIQGYGSSGNGTFIKKEGDKNFYKWIKEIPNMPEGTHVLFCKAYMADGTTRTMSKNIDVLDVVPVTFVTAPEVNHTDTWKSNLDRYNTQVAPNKQRAVTTFWAGENLCCYLKGYGIARGTVEIVGESGTTKNLVCSVTNPEMVDTVEWTAIINGASLLEKYQGKKTNITVRFKCYDMADQETVVNVNLCIDDLAKYFELHG